eukprot:jgi/Botrbrau1/1012/Bobra.114_1s0050.1
MALKLCFSLEVPVQRIRRDILLFTHSCSCKNASSVTLLKLRGKTFLTAYHKSTFVYCLNGAMMMLSPQFCGLSIITSAGMLLHSSACSSAEDLHSELSNITLTDGMNDSGLCQDSCGRSRPQGVGVKSRPALHLERCT